MGYIAFPHMKLHSLLDHVRRWFRGVPAVPDEPLPRIGTGAPVGARKVEDDSWFGRVSAAEQREWQELMASADLGPRLSDESKIRRREQRDQRRSASRRAAR
jgi:hypothetical protein